MATWRNNDREESKPTWLNKSQKRNCVRTVRGWEVPSSNAFGNQFEGWKLYGATAYVPTTELLVALPTDVTAGSIASGNMVGPNYFIRGTTGAYGNGYGGTCSAFGFTANRDVPNYTPYFTCPFNADSATSGGPDGVGVSHNGSNGSGLMSDKNYAYKVNKYGVSSLGLPYGVTAYVKVCLNDYNFTQTMSITSGNGTGFNLYLQNQLLDTTLVPTAVYEEFFGPTASSNHNNAVIRFTNQQATAGSATSAINSTTRVIVIGLTANDGSGATVAGFTSGATSYGISFAVKFDRPNPYG